MRKRQIVMLAIAFIAVAGVGFAFNGNGGSRFDEFLNGFKEAAAPVSTTGSGTFRAVVSKDESEIRYVLTFEDLEGDVLQAHIHIGHPQNAGGIVLWLCDSATANSPSASTPECTVNDPNNKRAGRVTGTLTAAEVLTQGANGIAAGEWEEVLALVRAGRTYTNIHSTKFTGGEIRSQIDEGDDDSDDHGNHHH